VLVVEELVDKGKHKHLAKARKNSGESTTGAK